MPNNTITLAQIIAKARQRADMEGSLFVTDNELTGYINIGISEIHDFITGVFEDYYVSKTVFALPQNNPQPLPSDFYKSLGCDFDIGGVIYSLRPFQFSERNAYANPYYINTALPNVFYSIRGKNIEFIPQTTISGSVNFYYIPECQYFAEDGTDLNEQLVVLAPQIIRGYEEYLILDAALKCLIKEESDITIMLALREAQKKRIMDMAARRDAGEPYRITDITTGTLQSNYIYWLG